MHEHPLPGDVILYPVTPRSALSSRLVAAAELIFGAGRGTEPYSHAAVLDEDLRHQYEAKWPRSGRFLVDHSRTYEVWRIGRLTEAQRAAVLCWCRMNCGQWYNMIGLLTGGLLGLPRTAVCSQFAGRAYEFAGIRIGAEGKRILSPNAIADHEGARMIRRVNPVRWVI